jgi:hypothetical protein
MSDSDPIKHDELTSKQTEKESNHFQKKKEEYKDDDDNEDEQYWRHFDDYDWDKIVPYSLEHCRILYLHHYTLQYIHFVALSLPLPLLRPVSVSLLFHGMTKRTGSRLC